MSIISSEIWSVEISLIRFIKIDEWISTFDKSFAEWRRGSFNLIDSINELINDLINSNNDLFSLDSVNNFLDVVEIVDWNDWNVRNEWDDWRSNDWDFFISV